MNLKSIQLEISSKNILVTRQDENGFLQFQGFSPLVIEDWQALDNDFELKLYKEFFWSDIETPILNIENE